MIITSWLPITKQSISSLLTFLFSFYTLLYYTTQHCYSTLYFVFAISLSIFFHRPFQLNPSYQSPRLVGPQPSWLTRQNNLCWTEMMLTNPHRPGRPHRLVLSKLHRLSCLPNPLRFWSVGKMSWYMGRTRHDVAHHHLNPLSQIEFPGNLGPGYDGQWCLSRSC